MSIHEIAVISGKGGTGKTSITASFALLAGRAVIADCDVDAPDLHLILAPEVRMRHEFWSGREARIRETDCLGCGACAAVCRFGAVRRDEIAPGDVRFSIDALACEGCGVCVRECPAEAIDLRERLCGEWMVSETRAGPMVHARLRPGADNSGKLVATVRREARRVAEESHRTYVLIDGPPGIGCPVIASVTGASAALIVTEPTLCGEHDLERVLSLTRHFAIPAWICVNKWDINPGMTDRIKAAAVRAGAQLAGRVRYDRSVTAGQIEGCTAVEQGGPVAGELTLVWSRMLAACGIEPHCSGTGLGICGSAAANCKEHTSDAQPGRRGDLARAHEGGGDQAVPRRRGVGGSRLSGH